MKLLSSKFPWLISRQGLIFRSVVANKSNNPTPKNASSRCFFVTIDLRSVSSEGMRAWLTTLISSHYTMHPSSRLIIVFHEVCRETFIKDTSISDIPQWDLLTIKRSMTRELIPSMQLLTCACKKRDRV